MPNERDLPKKYGISKARYRELLYFVRQYDEKKALVNSSYGLTATAYSGMPSAHNNSSPTEGAALRYEAEKSDVEIIEKCAKKACDNNYAPGLYGLLMLNLAQGVSYIHMNAACGKVQFYNIRTEFFLILDNELKNRRTKGQESIYN